MYALKQSNCGMKKKLKNDEYEGSETDRVAIIVRQSSSARKTKTESFSFDNDIVLSPELQGVSSAIMCRQPKHLLSLVGGQTYAHSLILVFPDGPKINQEQPIRNALSPTTVTFNTSDDKVGPPWAAVYIIVSNAREYTPQSERERPKRPEGEDFKIKSADHRESNMRGQAATLKDNPTRVSGRNKFQEL
jgi:hypothetical protein